MTFIEEIKEKARRNTKTIILPEALDIRTLEATDKICKEDFCNVILIGPEQDILNLSGENGLDISKAKIVEPAKSEKYDEYVNALYELRKHKGMTEEEARELMKDPIYYGVMMVKMGEGDGLVSGAAHSTADTLRPALQIIKTKPETKIVSTFSIMVVPDCEYGENGLFVFSDSGLNQHPTSDELSEIAISSADSYRSMMGNEPMVAMLSYSTYGSAKADEVDRVIEATRLVKEKRPDIQVDGELQLDAAIVPSVGQSKAPGSTVAGKANVLIFPDLNSANIGYKLVERLAKAEAYGPMCQGMAKPVNDLSRGCKSDDIVGVVALTAMQAGQ